jgi:hypothetical protein
MPVQKSWLDEYNKRCVDEVGKYLLEERHNQEAYDWLVARTVGGPFTTETMRTSNIAGETTTPSNTISASSTISAGILLVMISFITAAVATLWASEGP